MLKLMYAEVCRVVAEFFFLQFMYIYNDCFSYLTLDKTRSVTPLNLLQLFILFTTKNSTVFLNI